MGTATPGSCSFDLKLFCSQQLLISATSLKLEAKLFPVFRGRGGAYKAITRRSRKEQTWQIWVTCCSSNHLSCQRENSSEIPSSWMFFENQENYKSNFKNTQFLLLLMKYKKSSWWPINANWTSVNEAVGMFSWWVEGYKECRSCIFWEVDEVESWNIKAGKIYESCTVQCQEWPNLGACDTGAESTANGSFGKGAKI